MWLGARGNNHKSLGPSCSNIGQHYPLNKSLSGGQVFGKPIALYIQWIEIYPSGSAIHCLNNWGQIVLNIQKNPYLSQATPPKILYFPTQKNPSIIHVTSNLEYPLGVGGCHYFRDVQFFETERLLLESSTLYDLWYDNNVLDHFLLTILNQHTRLGLRQPLLISGKTLPHTYF